MCPGRNVYIIPFGSYTTLRRPKGLKQIILWSSIQWNNPSNKLNSAKVLELKMQKWLESFHQLDLQTLHSAWTFQNCDAKARVDHEDAKVIAGRAFIKQLRFASCQSAWTFHFSSFESLMSQLPYLIKSMKGSQNLFKTFVKLYKNPSVSNTLVATNSVEQARK